MDLVPIKVKICRTLTGGKMKNDYPNFNDIEGSFRGDMDWSYYVDQFGGWCYDRVCGFGEADEENANDPHNNTDTQCQYGCLLVSKEFAKEAIKKFPDRITELTEEEYEKFYDNRSQIKTPEEIINKNIVGGITAKKGAGVELNQGDIDALDPEKDNPGITKNYKKRWATLKQRRKINIIGTK